MTKKLLLFICILTMLSGCRESSDEKAFRDWLVVDYENVLVCEGNIYNSYAEALNSLDSYCSNPNEETKNQFLLSANNHSENIENNLYPKSNITEDTYNIMEKYDIPIEDYIWFVNENYSESRREYDNLDNAIRLVNSNDYEGAKRELNILEAWFKYSRKYMIYSAMDMVAKSGDNNISYFKSVMSEYINIDDVVWLNDRDEIMEAVEEVDSEFSKKLNEYQLEVNEAENKALEANK